MALIPPSSLHLPSTCVFRLGTRLGTPSMSGLLPCLLGCLQHKNSADQEWESRPALLWHKGHTSHCWRGKSPICGPDSMLQCASIARGDVFLKQT